MINYNLARAALVRVENRFGGAWSKRTLGKQKRAPVSEV
jgi:hypothetical protein